MAWDICRACMQGGDLVSLFDSDTNNELLSEKFARCCSIKVSNNDNLPSLICLTCVDKLLASYQFREQCILSNETLTECLSEFKLTTDMSACNTSVFRPTDSQFNDSSATELVRIKRKNGSYIEYEIPIEDGECHYYPRIQENTGKRARGRQKKSLSKVVNFSTYLKQKRNKTPPESPPRAKRNTFKFKKKIGNDDPYINEDIYVESPTFEEGLTTRGLRKKRESRVNAKGSKIPKTQVNSLKYEPKDDQSSDKDEDMEPLSTLLDDDGDQNYSSDPDYNPNDDVNEPDDDIEPNDEMYLDNDNEIMNKNNSCDVLDIDAYEKDLLRKREQNSTTEVKKQGPGRRQKKVAERKIKKERDEDAEDLLLKETILAISTPLTPIEINPKPKIKKKYIKKTYVSAKVYTCDQCGKSFTKNHSLQSHIRRHLGIKPFVCSVCGAAFVINLELRRHMLRHTGVRPYQCKYCERRFGDFGRRQDHERLHLGERPFKCTLCDKSFTYRSVLANHKRTHTGEKKYSCEVCDRRFTKNLYQKNHIKVHHKELYIKMEEEAKEKKARQQEMLVSIAQKCTDQILAMEVKGEQPPMRGRTPDSQCDRDHDQASDHHDLQIAEEYSTEQVVGELPILD